MSAFGLHARRLVLYGLVGLSGTAVQYALYVALVEAGADLLAASLAGYAAGAVVNYLLNYRITFRSRAAHAAVAPRFFAVAFAGLGLNLLILAVLARGYGLHYLAAQALATLACFGATYALNSLWSFRSRAARPRKAAHP